MNNNFQYPPLSLYIHLPWCEKKCPYCDFNSYANKKGETQAIEPIVEQEYIQALLTDLQCDVEHFTDTKRKIKSIFIGGGTPSLFKAESINTLLEGVAQHLNLDDAIEITLEANPSSAEREKFYAFRQAGINRLSIGVQSFDDRMLQQLGRVHTANDAIEAFVSARAAGFDNVNLDLMFGLPKQTIEQAKSDIQLALDLEAEHISYYQLTLEPNTLFHARPPVLPAEQAMEAIEEQGLCLLHAADYHRYEVSAYARQSLDRGRERLDSVHNLNYWQYGDYLGIGAGAHGKLSLANKHVIRTAKYRNPDTYMQSAKSRAQSSVNTSNFYADKHILEPADIAFEFILNASRLLKGFTADLFTARTGLSFATIADKIDDLKQRGLLIQSGEYIKPGILGMRFLNEVQIAFLP